LIAGKTAIKHNGECGLWFRNDCRVGLNRGLARGDERSSIAWGQAPVTGLSDSESEAPNRFHFDTEALPERDRFAAWCEEVMRRLAALDVVKRDNTPLRASSDVRRLGAIDIGVLATTPLDMVRTPNLMQDGNDALYVMLMRDGVAYQTQREQALRLDVGQGIVCDGSSGGGVAATAAASRWWVLRIPRSRIVSLVPHLAEPAGARLDKDVLALSFLFAYLKGTLDVDVRAGRAAQLYEDHIVDLTALALGAERDQQVLIEERSMRAVRRAAILREIEIRMGDAKLNAAAVGSTLGISARYVNMLLEDSGQSFTQHLLNRRLDYAAERLRDARHHHRRIADIAGEAGFVDLSTFNRAFRLRFGDTPSAMRAESGKKR
jgi:AraC-like DNA-binding protein